MRILTGAVATVFLLAGLTACGDDDSTSTPADSAAASVTEAQAADEDDSDLAEEAEQILEGVSLEDAPDAIEAAAQIASLVCEPIDDMRASAQYRRAMVRTLARRVLMEAAGPMGESA